MSNANEQLKRYVERIERLEQEKKELAEDISEIYVEVKSAGFDVKAMRQMMVETYMNGLGLEGTPMGDIIKAA